MAWTKVNEVDARWALGQYAKLQRSLMRYDEALTSCKRRTKRLRGSLASSEKRRRALERVLGTLEYRLQHRARPRHTRLVRTPYAWMPVIVEIAAIQMCLERAWLAGQQHGAQSAVSVEGIQRGVSAVMRGDTP